jgi:hypothetical protein
MFRNKTHNFCMNIALMLYEALTAKHDNETYQ